MKLYISILIAATLTAFGFDSAKNIDTIYPYSPTETYVDNQTDYDFGGFLANKAYELTSDDVIYDPSYVYIDYPNGDVAPDKGVCTDVVIRAYRKIGIDLQVKVHEDMLANLNLYNEVKTDHNIDHRRVRNLMIFFERFGDTYRNSKDPKDYAPGDIVCWNLGGAITHI